MTDGQRNAKKLIEQQPLSRLLKLKEINPILKALLKFCTITSSKNIYKMV